MTLNPPRRTFKESQKHNRVRDVDAVGRARNFKALGFALYGGVPLGLAAGSMMGHPFLGLLLGPALIGTFAMVVAAIQEVPGDGEAYLRIARIYRDGMKKPEEALLWFRRAVTEAQLPKGQEILTRREMAREEDTTRDVEIARED